MARTRVSASQALTWPQPPLPPFNPSPLVPPPLPTLPRFPDVAYRTESPWRRRRGRRPGQASQRGRVGPGPRIHPPNQDPMAMDRLGPPSRGRTAEFGHETELQLPDSLARSGVQEASFARSGKAVGQLRGDEGPHPLVRPPGVPVSDVCGKLSPFFSPSRPSTSAGNVSLAANRNYVPQNPLQCQPLFQS